MLEPDEELLAQELLDVLTTKGRTRPRHAPAAAEPVDRTTDRWLRIRTGCQHGADYIDLDAHADGVCRVITSLQTQAGPGRTPSLGKRATEARRSTS